MITEYPVGIKSFDESPITGFKHSEYHSDEILHRIILLSNYEHSEHISDSEFSELLEKLNQSNKITFLGSNFNQQNLNLNNKNFPPTNGFTFENDSSDHVYIWRWITMESPDFVILVNLSSEEKIKLYGFENHHFIYNFLKSSENKTNNLLKSLSKKNDQSPGKIPSIEISGSFSQIKIQLQNLIQFISSIDVSTSSARKEIQRRQHRTPNEVSKILSKVYGHKLDQPINYVQGVSISGRIRLAQLDKNYPKAIEDIPGFVSFILNENQFTQNTQTGPNLAGLCWADELSDTTGDKKWMELIIKTADIYEPRGEGLSPKPCDPNFGCEDMFFISTMLGRAYKISKNEKYLNTLINYLNDANTQHKNGLFYHNRVTPYFWGRGNGFAALAYAEALHYIPDSHSLKKSLIEKHINHINALIKIQTPTGMWTQLLDEAGTYQELSATCMIGYSITRGFKSGILNEYHMNSAKKAWQGTLSRIDDSGELVDVCTGTGFQSTKSDYFYRKAEYGYDDRGGSMAIWFSTEMENLLT